MATAINGVKEANTACAAAWEEFRDGPCTQTFNNYFSNVSIQEMVSKYCTHQALESELQRFSDFMRDDDDSPAIVLRDMSQDHEINRRREAALVGPESEFQNYFFVKLQAVEATFAAGEEGNASRQAGD